MKILIILFFSFLQINHYDFANVYKKDVEKLKADKHNNVRNNSNINVFKKFSSIDISKFKETKRNDINKWNLTEWNSKNDNVNSIKQAIKCVKTPNGLCLNFIGFKFVNKQNTYYYISVESQGLIEYSINKKDYHILNESIIKGLDDVYFETKSELRKVLDE